ncbi:hypothetical protein [Xanthomonas phage RTH11]|nr:hypothetical protein [Xanthomonas phage RTH11]
MDEYTGYKFEPDFNLIRGRSKVFEWLAELLREVRDPNDPRWEAILRFPHRQSRILETRRVFRINPTLAALVVRLIDYKQPLEKKE